MGQGQANSSAGSDVSTFRMARHPETTHMAVVRASTSPARPKQYVTERFSWPQKKDDSRAAASAYTGARLVQHSTGVRDGADGFVEFFEPFIERNPVR